MRISKDMASAEKGSWRDVLLTWRLVGLRYTQDKAAKFLGVTLRTYQRWESGEISPSHASPFLLFQILRRSDIVELEKYHLGKTKPEIKIDEKHIVHDP